MENEIDFQEFEHIDFGWANGWGNSKPEEYVRREKLREKLGFELKEVSIGHCSMRYYCDELNYSYKVDSSD